MAGKLNLAIGQPLASLSVSERLAWLVDVLPGLADKKVDLLLLPELFACGYNIADQVSVRAEPSDGAFSKEVSCLARASGVAIHYGYAEREEDHLYNSAQCFGPDGAKLGAHRKLIFPPGFEQEYFTAGEGCELFEFKGFKIATLICFDSEFPELTRHVAKMGADLILVPTALGARWDWVSHKMIPTRAFENGVYLAYANCAGTENGMDFLGQSFIASPDGKDLVRAKSEPTIICGTLRQDKISAAQKRLPYLEDVKRLNLV